MQVAKTKALISFAVTAKLICVFVFAYAKSLFSRSGSISMIMIIKFEPRHEKINALHICENKDADQLRGNQRLRSLHRWYTIPLLPEPKISSF